MSTFTRPAGLAGLLAALALFVPFSATVAAPDKKEVLVPANLNAQNDTKGFRWDLSRQGYINNGTNYCFNRAMVLSVNGSEFYPRGTPMMTKQGEFVFSSKVGGIEITRRVKIDKKQGATRFVEVFKNTGRRKVTVTIRHYTRLSRTAQTVVSNTGRAMFGAPLDKKEYAVLAFQRYRYPSVLFQLSSLHGRVKPSIQVQSNRTIHFDYVLEIGPNKSSGIAVTIMQRKFQTQPTPAQLANEFKPFLDTKWTSDLPGSIRRSLVNLLGGSAVAVDEPGALLGELNALVDSYAVEDLDKHATLFLAEDSKVTGQVKGAPVKVKTALGAVEIPFEDVALIRGGAGKGRPMRCYLRTGEVLCGQVTTSLNVDTKVGLSMKVDPAGIEALFLPRNTERDGKPAEGSEALLQTHDGGRLAVRDRGATILKATSPWGGVEVTLDQVRRLSYATEPYPGLWLTLVEGTRFPIAPHGTALAVASTRFGKVEVHMSDISGLITVKKLSATPFGGDGPTTVSHCLLLGASRLVGDIAQDEIELVMRGGDATTIKVASIKQIEQQEGESGRTRFEVETFGGETFTGSFKARVLPIKTPRGVRRVPVGHVMMLKRVKPKPKPKPKPDTPEKTPDDTPDEKKKPADNPLQKDF